MNTIIFDGKKHALQREGALREKTECLRSKKTSPKLVSILIGQDSDSERYLSLKQKAGERTGVTIEIKRFSENISEKEVIEFIKKMNINTEIHGIMVQLPIPEQLASKQKEILETIVSEKDVDGMREDSLYLAPVVKAVMSVIADAGKCLSLTQREKIVVVGAKGFVGRRIIKALETTDYEVEGVDLGVGNMEITKDAKILISATGKPNLIKAAMVKEGVVAIDIGASKGDMDFDGVVKKAAYITPVPGGIGPMTIFHLMENIVNAAVAVEKKDKSC
ncbi:bifunctional 5,10-methylenetetrahydrofolate dehydrogenase/5,10-methenyltetrahydrofolate cyclohydrolase [Patescibacteria group bacterium]|nr:bifunctional 5,10-methylenetetrahydrofolate dehydrogenase/5,10-methenyltetrahydrofolate cyclohydrolase [Patescibacteria group bacterium]MBU0777171.1 bifunctional 5,10-methylenetetrahydrofolate dehydrogenase/5,10-methenyltetrahydrofolate cyclohydrolase [Patescibacteria group bacterium]MBU0845866.1 bifunctional 5,10-methylenetetrahydrofolate dehydrogenase/5,10-methenyltetrahydrofolate cyclohydrolase [Patescibacteria group bacterium]MBU0922893.1 bifunctional 5,10-methylenetetrahydrofolate dehydr